MDKTSRSTGTVTEQFAKTSISERKIDSNTRSTSTLDGVDHDPGGQVVVAHQDGRPLSRIRCSQSDRFDEIPLWAIGRVLDGELGERARSSGRALHNEPVHRLLNDLH